MAGRCIGGARGASWRRALVSAPLVRQVGSPSGFGRYGILDDDGQQVLCHQCGRWFVSVAAHVAGGHGGMRGVEYKRLHGLQGVALVSRGFDYPGRTRRPIEVELFLTGPAPAVVTLGQLLAGGDRWAREEWARRQDEYHEQVDDHWAQQAQVLECPQCRRRYAKAPGWRVQPHCGRLYCARYGSAGRRRQDYLARRDAAIVADRATGSTTWELAQRYKMSGLEAVRVVLCAARRTEAAQRAARWGELDAGPEVAGQER